MKKTTKYTFLISGLLLSLLTAITSLILSGKLTSLINDFNTYSSMTNVFNYSLIFLIVIPIAVLLLITAIVLNFSLFKFPKANQLAQIIIAFLNLAIFITVIVYYVIIEIVYHNNLAEIINAEIKDLPAVDFTSIRYDIEVFTYSSKIIMLSIVSVAFIFVTNCYLLVSCLKKQDKNDKNINPNPKSKLEQEIAEMKQELELKKLKEEYVSLYKQIHNDDEKSSK